MLTKLHKSASFSFRYQSVVVRSLRRLAEEPVAGKRRTASRGRAGRAGRSRSLLDEVRRRFRFEWKPRDFSLLDEEDSVNFGDLQVAPPPYGE